MTASAAEAGCRVIVFARAPEPGKVKTRLIPALSAAGAAELHRRLVRHTLGAATGARIGPVELWCTPDTNDPFFRECQRSLGVSLYAQGGGDLGTRMQRAFESALARSRHAILAGSDIPALSAQYFRDAAQALVQGGDVVIGPAEDGGYVLVGLSRCDPELFRGIPWGGPEVMAETRRRIAALAWCLSELPVLWDVDRPEDLGRLPQEMR
jgi:rSAM/selenodomain-associated transferase 1